MSCDAELTRKAVEGGIFNIFVPLKPNTTKAVWTLKNAAGDIVNGKNKVNVDPVEDEFHITLTGGSLVATDGEATQYVTVESIYDTDDDIGLNYRVGYSFTVCPLNITPPNDIGGGGDPDMNKYNLSFDNDDLVDGVSTWVLTVTHSLGDAHPIVEVYNENGDRITIPVSSIDENSFSIDFGSSITGTWHLTVLA